VQVGLVSDILYNLEPPRVYITFLGSLQQPNLARASPHFQLTKATYGAASGIFVQQADPQAPSTTLHRCVSSESLCGDQYCNPTGPEAYECEQSAAPGSVAPYAPCGEDEDCVGWDNAPVPAGAYTVRCQRTSSVARSKTCSCDVDYTYDAASGFCVYSNGDRNA
jgi:hypothetical protein